eukprot:scaffold310_cov168-Amphora_coffeaeformis.AAC.15
MTEIRSYSRMEWPIPTLHQTKENPELSRQSLVSGAEQHCQNVPRSPFISMNLQPISDVAIICM